MPETRLGFFTQLKSYPATFWVANTMEIFERMAWYGFFALSSLYMTGPVETGALGFTSEQRGQLQAIVPFFLYLFPILTGALADRYGYKKMFTIAYLVMIVSYYMLGQFTTFPSFLLAFMFVAVGAAIFKPVVVGTIARVTNERNSATGFGIFYMMVNIGGFVGPMVAGAVRGSSWKNVFVACSLWATLNLVIVLLFYKDPTTEAGSAQKRTLKKVLDDMVEVLGNLRFFIAVFVVLIALMVANQEPDWFTWTQCAYFIPIWLVGNAVYDLFLARDSGRPVSMGGVRRSPFLKRMYCSNWRFALFLFIMSGFWTSFQQIFITMPEYIRDFAETKPMVSLGQRLFDALGRPQWVDRLAAIEETEFLAEFDDLVRRTQGVESMVPTEPEKVRTDRDLNEDWKKAYKELQRLARSRGVNQDTRDRLAESAANLRATRRAERTNLESALRQAKALIRTAAGEKVANELAADPGLNAEDRSSLISLVGKLNAPNVSHGVTSEDLFSGARTVLQYKVRIGPLELGKLIQKAQRSPSQVSDAHLALAVKTINNRLDQKGKPMFDEVEQEKFRNSLRRLVETHSTFVPRQALVEAAQELSTERRAIEPKELALGIRDIVYRPVIWERIDAGRQVNAEHIVNFDAGAIVLLQVLISFLMAKFHRFTTMIVGMVIAAVGIGLSAAAGGTMIGPVGGSLLVVIIGIVTFAVGEMMASPTSQEYVGRIAPRDKVALYMGYYFVAIALGNLFSGILSGQLYGKLARDIQRPDLMWLAFGGIMLLTALAFWLYNMFALPKSAADTLTSE